MPGNTNVPFEVSDHEFKMGPVNMLWFFSLATVAALTEVQSKQKLDSTSTGFCQVNILLIEEGYNGWEYMKNKNI